MTSSGLTIEELAAQTGLTVRNLRSHRARGLLQPPVVRDRVGYYGPQHLERVRLVQHLQAEGFNLAAIKQVIEQGDAVLSVVEAARRPFEDERPEVFTAEELAERLGDADPRLLAEGERLGILIALGDGRYEAPAPSLIAVAEELAQDGVPLRHSLAVVAKVRAATRSIAAEFARLAVDDVWRPFEAAGYPPERWAELADIIERLRPMAAQVVLAMFQITMSDEVERVGADLWASPTRPRGAAGKR
jgi:DNA-binding transcriptional MerR regulator